MNKENLQPIAIAAGVLVAGDILMYSMKRKARCTKLTNIYSEDSALKISEEYQKIAFESAKNKLRELMSAGDMDYTIEDIQLYVANQLRECDWKSLKTDEQKSVWNGIKKIVSEVNDLAKADPDKFLSSF